jgi:hypothetical protein
MKTSSVVVAFELEVLNGKDIHHLFYCDGIQASTADIGLNFGYIHRPGRGTAQHCHDGI